MLRALCGVSLSADGLTEPDQGSSGRAVAAALLGATVGASTDLFSISEWGTVTVPVVIMIALMLASIRRKML
jgi:hypothetical protein